jgi:PhnB protein
MNVSPYLSFEGRCAEAIEFYKTNLAAEVKMLTHFKDMPPSAGPQGGITPGTENKVMHATLQIGQSIIFVSDGRCTGNPKFHGIALSIAADSDDQAEKLFAALSAGGTVGMPMTKTFFASRFGMVNDRFGVPWMVIKQP